MPTFHGFTIPSDWNTPVDGTWSDWMLLNDPSNPISATIEYGRAASYPSGVFRPETYGAIYNVKTVAQARLNTTAINAAIAAMPQTGGTLVIRDVLYTFGVIDNPLRTIVSTPLIIPFTIRGESERSQIINLKPGTDPAIRFVWDGINAAQFVDAYPPLGLFDLLVVSQGKGVQLSGVGKNFRSKNIRVSRCKDTALFMDSCHGGTYDFTLYCNYAVSLSTSLCNHVEWDLNIRESVGTGWVSDQSNDHFGRAYLESNYFYAMDHTDCDNMGGTLDLHLESNQWMLGANANYPAVKFRRCRGYKFTGNVQQEVKQYFDFDDFSWRNNEILSEPQVWPSYFDSGTDEWTQMATDLNFWQPGFEPTLTKQDSDNSLQLECPLGMFNHEDTPGIATSWIVPFQTAFGAINFVTGDYVRLSFELELDEAGVDYFAEDIKRTISSIDTGTDTFTSVAHGRLNGDKVIFTSTTNQFPANIVRGTFYYVINKTNDTFQVSATAGGAAVNVGTGAGGTIVANFSHLFEWCVKSYLEVPGNDASSLHFFRNRGPQTFTLTHRLTGTGTGAVCYFFPSSTTAGGNHPAAPIKIWIRNPRIQRIPLL